MNMKKNRGFTLLEMLVAVGVFTVVAMFSVGSLLSITQAQRKAVALQTVQDNLRFGIDIMMKDMRTGSNYHCSDASSIPASPGWIAQNCDFVSGGGKAITFTNALGQDVTYSFNVTDNNIVKIIDYGVPQAFTSSDLVVDMQYYVIGAEVGELRAPLVTVIVEGTAGLGRAESSFLLQTSVAQRVIK
jgi:prepilin-type N-terminal cleavage/methylation domain-containing protein